MSLVGRTARTRAAKNKDVCEIASKLRNSSKPLKNQLTLVANEIRAGCWSRLENENGNVVEYGFGYVNHDRLRFLHLP